MVAIFWLEIDSAISVCHAAQQFVYKFNVGKDRDSIEKISKRPTSCHKKKVDNYFETCVTSKIKEHPM